MENRIEPTSPKRLDDSFIKLFFDENGRSKHRVSEKSLVKREQQPNIKNTKKKKYTKKQLITAIVASVVISTTLTSTVTNSVSNFIDQMEEDNTLDKALESYQSKIDEIMRNCEIREKLDTPNEAYGRVVNYEAENIAALIDKEFTTQKEKDIAIYTLYNSYGKSADSSCNNITSKTVSNLNSELGENYENLDDYLFKKGFQTEDEYDQKMRNFIVDEYKYNKSKDLAGGKQWK